MYGASDVLFGGGDNVTIIGHARAGMGYRNEFQTENHGLLRFAYLPIRLYFAMDSRREALI